MYGILFDSMLAWYARRNVDRGYLRLYAVTTLTFMGFANIATLVILGVHWDVPWAKEILTSGKNPMTAAALALGLLGLHLVFSSLHRSPAEPGSNRASPSELPSPWIAGVYMLLSVVTFIYVSGFAPLGHP